MLQVAQVAVCSDIHTKHSKQSECNVEFCILNLAVRKEISMGENVKQLLTVLYFYICLWDTKCWCVWNVEEHGE